jgi:hypothetical protein
MGARCLQLSSEQEVLPAVIKWTENLILQISAVDIVLIGVLLIPGKLKLQRS